MCYMYTLCNIFNVCFLSADRDQQIVGSKNMTCTIKLCLREPVCGLFSLLSSIGPVPTFYGIWKRATMCWSL